MSKSEKSAYFRHVFANTFFLGAFFQTFFNGFEISEIFFVALISTFLKLLLQMRRKRLQKTENLFLWMCLRI